MGPWTEYVIFRVAENFAHIRSRLGNAATYSSDTVRVSSAYHQVANACNGVWVNVHKSNHCTTWRWVIRFTLRPTLYSLK
jgi:hypothetical protein